MFHNVFGFTTYSHKAHIHRFRASFDRCRDTNGNKSMMHKYKFSESKLYVGVADLASYEQQLEFWVVAFASSHIGMSATRRKLIDACGMFARKVNIVDSGLKLPSYWPGDSIGKDDIFPDEQTAGRQVYRFGYTMISFLTIGNALRTYSIIQDRFYCTDTSAVNGIMLTAEEHSAAFLLASVSFAAAIASLFNASPLGLMPGFQRVSNDDVTVDNYPSDKKNTIVGFKRNDDIKFEPRGLTRITRHPLILPVVPWGFASSLLAGGRNADFTLFGGLALYAVVGCYCQDLRIIREEGSVGTIFQPENNNIEGKIRSFFDTTSFVPFGAVIDGRQSMDAIIKEIPIIPFLAGIPLGIFLEKMLLDLLIGDF